jgi:hypothetical protein
MVAWNINGKIEKTWEPRQVLRARWGKVDADKAIFNAAFEAEERYSEVASGDRRATSRSPSVGLAADTVRQQREMSLGAGRSSPSRAKSTTPSRAKSKTPSRAKSKTPAPKVRFSNSNNSGVEGIAEILEDFRLNYLECAGVETFRELNLENKEDFITI